MKEYIGNLVIEKNDKRDFSKLEKITGHLSVCSNVTFEAPKLTSVGGNLFVYSNVTFEAPKLTSVGGYLSVYSNVTLPQLTSVGGDLSEYSNVTLNCKFLKGIKYKHVDGYLFIIESEKESKGIKIYSGYNAKGVEKGKLIKQDTIYVAEKDNYMAHGTTIKKAVEDLEFKIISEKLKNEPIKKDTIITVNHYRLITGACEFGVKDWMDKNNVSENIKACELLPLLEKTNAYGLDKFKKLYEIKN